MKKIYTLFMAAVIALTSQAQLVFNENFTSYTTGDLGTQGGWVTNTENPDVTISSATPLTYTGYNTAGGNYAIVNSFDGRDPNKRFSTPINTASGRFIYMSFLVRATDAQQSDNSPNYTLSIYDTVSGFASVRPIRFYIAEDPNNNSRVRFGITVGSSHLDWTSTGSAFTYNTTYLIVIRYDVISGPDNDAVYLWVNPSLASEPSTASAKATETNSASFPEVDFGSQLTTLGIFQSDNQDSPDAAYDAFRIAHGATSSEAWTNLSPAAAALPVRITSFNASQDNLNNIKLIWNTEEESGITNYVVEKSTDGRTFNAIGTVAAANQKTYSFTDVQSGSDYSYYRLKMMEDDGSFKYSYIVSLKSKLSLNISLSPNPVKDRMLIQHPKVINEGHIQIVNSNGQLLKDVRVPASTVISTIDMSGFANGMYHVIFKNGPDMFTKTILKQ